MFLEVDLNLIYTIIGVTCLSFTLLVIVYFAFKFTRNVKLTRKDEKQLLYKVNFDIVVMILGGQENVVKVIISNDKLEFTLKDIKKIKENCSEITSLIKTINVVDNVAIIETIDAKGMYDAFLYDKKWFQVFFNTFNWESHHIIIRSNNWFH